MFKKKSLITLVSILAILCVTVGGTLAYLVTTSGPVTNTFNPSKVTTAVEESFDGKRKSDVKIKNTGDTDAYIRAAVVVTWQDKDGNVYGQSPASSDYKIEWGKDWVNHSDGFWYYTKPVAAGNTTGNLINSCTRTSVGTAPDGYHLNVEIIGSGIQSKGMGTNEDGDPTKPVVLAWGVDPSTLK